MFEVEVRDVNIPIVTFLKSLDERILIFLKHVGQFILDLFNTAKWSWIHWFFVYCIYNNISYIIN